MELHVIPWNCSCHRNWRTPSSMEFLGIPWNCWCHRNWRTPNSMEFHGTARVIDIGALQVPWHSMEFHGTARVIEIGALQVPWNSTICNYTICISGITHYVSRYHSKSHWNLFWLKSSMELSPEFHGIFWTTFEQHPWFHRIPRNLSNKTSSSIPWNSMELLIPLPPKKKKVPRNSMEFHGTFLKFHGIPWNSMEIDKFHI